MGILRYLMGRVPLGKPVTFRHSSSCLQVPPKIVFDFCVLAFRPMQAVKCWNASIRIFKDGGSALQKRIKLSANIKWVNWSFLQWGWNWKSWCVAASLRTRVNYSIVMTKRRGERGPLTSSLVCPQRSPLDTVDMRGKPYGRSTTCYPFNEDKRKPKWSQNLLEKLPVHWIESLMMIDFHEASRRSVFPVISSGYILA